MPATLNFIGEIHSPLKTLEDCPLQESEDAPEATIVIHSGFEEGIKDLKKGSEIIILTWLHNADRSVIKCIPRRQYDAPQIGVFSTRSPDRPNPIGMHEAKVLSVDNNTIKVAALEVLNGTPVVDIKPVIKRG